MIKGMDSDNHRVPVSPVTRQVNPRNRLALVWKEKQGKEKFNVTRAAIIQQNVVGAVS